MQIESSESIAVTYLRTAALISIVSCHILQALDNRWAWVLNIGVQVFFFISGYLYGHKNITDWPNFYKSRLKRVYLPFVTVALFTLFCYKVLAEIEVTKMSILSYILDTQWFVGGKRCWPSLVCHCYYALLFAYSFASSNSVKGQFCACCIVRLCPL